MSLYRNHEESLGIVVSAALIIACCGMRASSSDHEEPSEFMQRAVLEERTDSQIMHTMHWLADVYGPRLTGSPNELAASRWAVSEMTAWGMERAHLESWQFGHPGWSTERASGYIVAPVHGELDFKVAAWTPGTKGVLRASAVLIHPPDHPSAVALNAFLASVKQTVRNKIVLVGSGATVPIPLNGVPLPRLDEDIVASLLKPTNASYAPTKADSPSLSRPQVHRAIDSFLKEYGALMRVDDAFRPYGEIGWEYNDTYDVSKALPTVVLRNEDFSRIARLLADRPRVELQFEIANQSYPAGALSNNVVAEITGTDKQDSVIILGAHIDSWHLATGATDNAIGCAIMMEAAHILLKSGNHPRRTIRVVLFSGEEQGLLGSQAYVAEHFGTAEAPKSEFHKLDAYLNIDSGTGRIRAANVFGPPSAADFLRPMLKPFEPVGFEGVVAHTVRQLRSTDATTFSWAGLPAIGLSQDPIDYSFTWHSDLDTCDQVLTEDAQEAALEIAVLTFQLADADESVPRFAEREMPSQR